MIFQKRKNRTQFSSLWFPSQPQVRAQLKGDQAVKPNRRIKLLYSWFQFCNVRLSNHMKVTKKLRVTGDERQTRKDKSQSWFEWNIGKTYDCVLYNPFSESRHLPGYPISEVNFRFYSGCLICYPHAFIGPYLALITNYYYFSLFKYQTRKKSAT